MIHPANPVSNIAHTNYYNNLMGGDYIIISDFHAKTVLGVYDWEKEHPRDIYMTLYLGVDLSASSKTDDLNHTVDYDLLTQRLKLFCEQASFNLIEALAESCAQIILDEFNVNDVLIKIDKPLAIPCAKSVAVQIYRIKPNV